MSQAPLPRERIGRYAIERVIGEGGMGVVFSARDDTLDRSVAIKMIHQANADATAAERLRREARTLASVNHPNICQVYEIGDESGDVYIVMERLQGEALAARLARGSVPLDEAVPIGEGMLAALDALHGRGLVHRDLKPSNVFLTPHGVKLLDFGLARPELSSNAGDPSLTAVGTMVGTPRYMAPEQWGGEPASVASDLFATGAVLYEAVAGRPAFIGNSVLEIFHSIAHERPPALAGGLAAVRIDSVLQRAMAKRPEQRYPSAAAMAAELKAVMGDDTSEPAIAARAVTRLIVLPFRMLRPDPDVDFLAFSLPDAITSSLAGLQSLVLRSSATAARFAGATPDLKSLATEAEVDSALLGTLLRAGDQVRVAAQLVEVPSGTVQWSQTVQAAMQDLFKLQDDLARHIVESLAIPLSVGERRRLQRDVPATARAYEHYLRANEAARDKSSLTVARDLYRACVEEDPMFAPAWAQLGRAHRVLAKYGLGGADNVEAAGAAFRRALDLNPDLPLAHYLYTPFEIEHEGRALEAMVRLLQRARLSPGDPDLYTGLCLACRYAGLLDASVAADERARRHDPGARTSVAYTYFQTGEHERALAREDGDPFFVPLYALVLLGREQEALDHARVGLHRSPGGFFEEFVLCLKAAIEKDRKAAETVMTTMLPSSFKDPEGLLIVVWALAGAGATQRAVELLKSIENDGFVCTQMIERERWFDSIRDDPEVQRILGVWKRRQREAAEAFKAAGGEQLLGVTASAA